MDSGLASLGTLGSDVSSLTDDGTTAHPSRWEIQMMTPTANANQTNAKASN